jgi:hypothetical protein
VNLRVASESERHTLRFIHAVSGIPEFVGSKRRLEAPSRDERGAVEADGR